MSTYTGIPIAVRAASNHLPKIRPGNDAPQVCLWFKAPCRALTPKEQNHHYSDDNGLRRQGMPSLKLVEDALCPSLLGSSHIRI